MTLITQKEIKEINRLYSELKTYAAVAREMKIAPSTVKKYVIPGYTVVDESNIKRFEGDIPEFNPSIFYKKDWKNLCTLSQDELKEIKELWKELEI